jgi:long-chain acyl-CoA synthetase
MGGHKSKPIYSIELKNTETEEFSNIFKSPAELPTITHQTLYSLIKYFLFRSISEEIPKKKVLSKRLQITDRHKWLTFASLMKKVEKCANFLQSLNLQPNSQGLILIGLISKNKPEWIIFDLACSKLGIIPIGLFENSSSECLSELLTRFEVHYICCDRANLIKILSLSREKKCLIFNVFLMQKPEYQELHQATQSNIVLEFYCKKVKNSSIPEIGQIGPIFTLALTSGVTGELKACIISHKSFLCSILGADIPGLNLATRDVYLSYVPLSLLWERVILYKILVSGASVAFTDINSVDFIDDIQYFKPTLTLGIFKLLEKIYDGILEKIGKSSVASKMIFRKAFNSKLENYKKNGNLESLIYDKLIFKKIRQTLGGRMRLMIAGASVYRKGVIEYLKIVLSCEILQGYGSMESLVTCMCSMPGDTCSDHLGGPLGGYSFKLKKMKGFDVEGCEGKVFGELYLKGEKLFSGYYKGSSSEYCDSDGWYATGDYFSINPNNLAFEFIDTKECLSTLSNGKTISLQKIELIARESPYIESIFITVKHSCILAVIVPNEVYVRKHLSPNNVHLSELCQNFSIISSVFQDLSRVMKQFSLKPYEEIQAIYLEPETWISELMISPTLKLRRKNLDARYEKVFEKLLLSIGTFEYN